MIKQRAKTSYPINQSPLYKLSNRKKLATLLNVPLKDLEALASSNNEYNLFRIEPKQDGFSKPRKARDVEEPKGLLAVVHKKIFSYLSRIEVPDYLQSSTKNRSYISNAKKHICQTRAIKYDLKNFFPSARGSKVNTFFQSTLLCSPDVSGLLTKLCTYNNHLPTGSPISSILSYFTYKNMFDEIDALAKTNELEFTVYVDDLVLSGEKASNKLTYRIRKIITSHGLLLHERKTKFFPKGTTKIITGIAVTNQNISVLNERFKYIRLLEEEVRKTKGNPKQKQLIEKLVGLLGEASQIEPKFNSWLTKYKAELQLIRLSNPPISLSAKAYRKKNKKIKLLRIAKNAHNGILQKS